MKSIFIVCIFVILCVFAHAKPDHSRSMARKSVDVGSKGSAADLFVLAYIWEGESCYDDTSDPGCMNPKDYWEKYFTIHGLWPQYSSGGYPSFCTDEAFDMASPEAVGMDTMTTVWPNVQAEEGSSDYGSFWEHEWTKHGTCSELGQTQWFNATVNLASAFGTPASVTNAVGGTINADSLRSDMGGADKVSLQCDSGKYLSGAFSCWGMDSKTGLPTTQVTCPSDVQGEDTCSSSTISVPELSR